MTIAILKILLWILLAFLLVLVLICLLNVKITIYNRDKFGYRITVGGIKLDVAKFIGNKDKHKKSKKSTKKDKSEADKKDSKSQPVQKKKKSVGAVISTITRIAQTAAEVLPRGIRIKLNYLNIVVGGKDAAETAVNYGKYHAALSGLFALFDDYKGLFYGFRAKRNKVTINADFLASKTSADFKLTISFFVWQLVFSGVRIGIEAIKAIIEAEEE